ncbi:hypothetical protein RRF57_009851 [Xylaria bambusicola]|uniref:Uncharacterized protein n=1 Tax=Xylaria bambusicola TaxID=326684 RepID=A0AAN7URK0_9PEZI
MLPVSQQLLAYATNRLVTAPGEPRRAAGALIAPAMSPPKLYQALAKSMAHTLDIGYGSYDDRTACHCSVPAACRGRLIDVLVKREI